MLVKTFEAARKWFEAVILASRRLLMKTLQTALNSHDLKMNFLSFEKDFQTANYKCIDIYAKRTILAYIYIYVHSCLKPLSNKIMFNS